MEVAVLTTRLEAQISAFQAQMAAAERMLKEVQKVMKDLEKTTIELQATINKLGVDASEMDKSIASLAKLGGKVDDLTKQFRDANKAAKDLSIPVSQTVRNISQLKEETEATNDLAEARRDAANAGRFRVISNPLAPGGTSILGPGGKFMSPSQAAAAGFQQLALPPGSYGAPVDPSRQFGRSNFINDPFLQSLRQRGIPYGSPLPLGGGLPASQVLAGRFGETEPHRSYGAARDAENGVSFLASIGKFFSSGGGNARRGIGNFFGGGGPGGFFQGILPGGRRATAGAVLTGIGLAAAAGPAVGVGAGGLLGALPNVLGTMIGAAATLKLAFSGITSAAFTSKAAFDQLTPVQKSFVQNLRSIDAGFMTPLEKLAQTRLLPKLTTAINAALTPSSIAAANGIVGAFSGSLGAGANIIGKFLGSSGFDRQLQQMMTGDAAGIKGLATAFTNFLDVIVRIGNAALPFTKWLGDTGVKASKLADSFIKTQQASGGLADFFRRAKESLQAIGGLFGSIGKAILALGNAIGLKNSIGLIKLVTQLFKDLADFLNKNRPLFNNVLAGLIKAAGDLLRALSHLIGAFGLILSAINKLIQPLSRLTGGLIGVRGAIDAIVIALTVRWLVGWLGAIDKTLLAIGTLRASLLKLALMRIVIPVVIATTIYGPLKSLWEKVFGKSAFTGTTTVTGGTPNIPGAPGQRDRHGYIPGSPGYEAYQAGLRGVFPAHETRAAALHDSAFAAGVVARLKQQEKNLGAAIINISRGYTPTGGPVKGLPGHAAPGPFDTTGPGGIGFRGPTTAGGAVFTAQQNLSQAMTPGSGVSFQQQLALARRYQAAAAAAYTHLQNQQVGIKDAAKKQAELTTLARDEAAARRDIARITERQAKALAKLVDDSRKLQITQHQTEISAIRSNLTGSFSSAASPSAGLAIVNRALLAAGRQLQQLKEFKDKLLAQDNQTSKLKSEENRIQEEINSTLGIIRTAQKDQAKALKAQIAAGLNRKWERIFGIGTGTTQSAESIRREERNALLHIVHGLSRTYGSHRRGVVGPTDPYAAIPGAGHMSIDQLIRSLQQHGVHFSKRALEDFQHIKGYLAELQKLGQKVDPVIRTEITALLKQIEDNTNPKKNAIPSYHLASVKDVMATLASSIKDPAKRKAAAERLMEMEIYGGHLPNGPAAAGIPVLGSGRHPIERALAGHGIIVGPHGRSLLSATMGKPENPADAAAIANYWPHNRMWDLQQNKWVPNVNPKYNSAASGPIGPVTININGYNKDKAELAAEVRNALLRTHRRNPTQTRGPNAGKGVGLS